MEDEKETSQVKNLGNSLLCTVACKKKLQSSCCRRARVSGSVLLVFSNLLKQEMRVGEAYLSIIVILEC